MRRFAKSRDRVLMRAATLLMRHDAYVYTYAQVSDQ